MNKSEKENQPRKNQQNRNQLRRNQPKTSHPQMPLILHPLIPVILLISLLLIGCGYNTQKSTAPAAVTPAHSQSSSPASAKSQTGNLGKTQEEATGKNAGDLGGEIVGKSGEENAGKLAGEPGKENTGKSAGEPGKENTGKPAGEPGEENAGEPGKETTEQTTEETIRQARTIDFTIQESPVDMARYDKQTDQRYKEAFLKAVTNQIPIYFPNQKGTSFYKDLVFGAEEMEEDEFQDAVRQSDYFYQDFDGDGLPELIVNTKGTCVLKYHPRGNKVELYHQKGEGWNLLGKGQMYAEFTEYTKGTTELLYCYEYSGQEFCLRDILTRMWDYQGYC